jgi:thiosulfate/3-mercaptopyruvate sulfurtransferase
MSPVRSVLFRARRLAALVAVSAAVCLVLAGVPALAADPLVSPQWLKENLASPNLVVLDIRSALDGGGAEDYAKGHIPGAVHSDYDKGGWRVTRNGLPFMLPSASQLEALISDLGIDEDSHVVVVPAGVHVLDFGAAARVYWTLKVAGHDNVSILDGGFAGWQSADFAVEAGENRPAAKIFTVTFDKSRLAELADVEPNAKSPRATLVDARPASFFAGKEKAPAVKAYGHIPGAISLDSAAFYDAKANRLKPKAELAAVAAALPEGPVVSYCNTGHWAATDWFVLSELLGRKDARLYYGSMVEWTADAQRPVDSARTRFDDLKKALGL